MSLLDRDAANVDALLTDLYLDTLLGGAIRAAPDPAGAGEQLDPAVRRASDRLRHDLVRVHPSFRFEERLATRLAEAAVALRLPAAAGAEGVVIPFARGPEADPEDPAGPAALTERELAERELARPILIGGALTSAALSIAGAAYVAWRRTHAAGRAASPMARAVRSVRTARAARSH